MGTGLCLAPLLRAGCVGPVLASCCAAASAWLDVGILSLTVRAQHRLNVGFSL